MKTASSAATTTNGSPLMLPRGTAAGHLWRRGDGASGLSELLKDQQIFMLLIAGERD